MQETTIDALNKEVSFLKEQTSLLVNKNSEAGFREQFELYQLRLKEEEERKQEIVRKQKAEEEERKQEIIRKQKEEERK